MENKILIENFKQWQHQALDIALNLKSDSINWIYDIKGLSGKSTWAEYMTIKHKAVIIPNIYINNHKKTMNYCFDLEETKLIIIDINKYLGNKISYSAIDNIKDGILQHYKKYKTKLIYTPTIIVLSSSYPDIKCLSKHKWNIYQIQDDILHSLPLPKDLLHSDTDSQ